MSAARYNSLIQKISDYLENRQKTNNFGKCKKCAKNVYWSTTKVASHIRSGHCKGATAEEVQMFKVQEFVYETPKHLIHRSFVGKTPRSEDDKQENTTVKRIFVKQESADPLRAKRRKSDTQDTDESFRLIDDTNETDEVMYELEGTNTDDEKVSQIVYVTNEQHSHQATPKISDEVDRTVTSKEEKFIEAVYPQYKGHSKMQLIDELLDLQRRNELLQNKVKTYEETINKLL